MVLKFGERLASFWADSRRIFTVSKKPEWAEFLNMAKVTGIGILIIGLIGFAVFLLFFALNLGGK